MSIRSVDSEKLQRTVLVEDDPDDEVMTLRGPRQTDPELNIVVARDGVEGLEYLLSTGPREGQPRLEPHLVILDLKLAKLDGLSVLRELRADRTCGVVPVVVLTSSDENSDIRDSYRLGVNSYICKPMDFSRYQKIMALLSTYWLAINESPRQRVY